MRKRQNYYQVHKNKTARRKLGYLHPQTVRAIMQAFRIVHYLIQLARIRKGPPVPKYANADRARYHLVTEPLPEMIIDSVGNKRTPNPASFSTTMYMSAANANSFENFLNSIENTK